MNDYKFTLSVSAGLSITFPNTLLWIDAVHDIKAPTYSTVTPEIWEQMQKDPHFVGPKLTGPDAIAVSHTHIDHFTWSGGRRARAAFPNAKLILPEKYFPEEIYVHGDDMHVDVNGVDMHYLKTHHCTKRHYDTKNHYSMILNDGNINIFMPIDASMSDPTILDYAEKTDVDIAIISFMWVIMEKGRNIIENVIRPRHLIVYHLPFLKDDHWDYNRQTLENVRCLTKVPDVRVMTKACQCETISI